MNTHPRSEPRAVSCLGRFEATFQPHRMDTLRPEALPFVGRRMVWRVMWMMDEDDPFPGELAVMPEEWDDRDLGWCPYRDLADVVILRSPFVED